MTPAGKHEMLPVYYGGGRPPKRQLHNELITQSRNMPLAEISGASVSSLPDCREVFLRWPSRAPRSLRSWSVR
jgi:hypothetical protein